LFLIAAGAIGLFAIWPRPPKAPAHIASTDDLEHYLDTLVHFGRPPGLSLAVVKDERVVYSRAFGSADGPRHRAATPDTTYRWWSMTKIPTAIAVLQLQERGALSLDDPVTRHVPFFEVHSPSSSHPVVTVRHLLNHSSGLRDAGLDLVRWLHLPSEPPVDQTAFTLHDAHGLPVHTRH
jgi:CubicO group peptidase (beta-lactamase class C family)